MADLHVRSDSVDVEQIMKQIRSRIRDKRGVDYKDAELQRLASAKLEQFADPSGLQSGLLDQFRQRSNEPSTSHDYRGPRRWAFKLLHPLLKHVQRQTLSDLNFYFEIIHNLVIEVTRLDVEVQSLKMRVESLSTRIDFDERRARVLEGTAQPRHDAPQRQRPHDAPRPGAAGVPASPGPGSGGQPPAGAPSAPSATLSVTGEDGGRPGDPNRPDGSRRRRRRRRRRPGHTLAESPLAGGGQPAPGGATPEPDTGGGPDDDDDDGATE
jgi:hypothetical protein